MWHKMEKLILRISMGCTLFAFIFPFYKNLILIGSDKNDSCKDYKLYLNYLFWINVVDDFKALFCNCVVVFRYTKIWRYYNTIPETICWNSAFFDLLIVFVLIANYCLCLGILWCWVCNLKGRIGKRLILFMRSV